MSILLIVHVMPKGGSPRWNRVPLGFLFYRLTLLYTHFDKYVMRNEPNGLNG